MPKTAAIVSIATALGVALIFLMFGNSAEAPVIDQECPVGTVRVGEGCMAAKDECEMRGDQYSYDEAQQKCVTQYICDGDAKICPDGSSVGRTGPKCEFAACPSPDATSARVTTFLGGSATGLNVTLQPKKVVSDSRCPEGVQCIWAGTVEVRTVMSTQVSHGEQTVTLGVPVAFGDFAVTLTDVTPYPKQGTEIAESSYRFTYKIEKAEPACPTGTERVGEGCMPAKEACELGGDQYYYDEAQKKCLTR